jgi:serine protease
MILSMSLAGRRRSAFASAAVLLAAAAVCARARAADFVPHRVVVKYAPADRLARAASHGADRTRVLHVRDVRAALTALRRRPDVEYAVPDVRARAAGFIPNDPGRGATPSDWQSVQWNFDGPFGVNAPDAWANLIADGRPGGLGVKIAVLDTGVAYANRGKFRKSPDLAQTHFIKGYDFVSRDPYANDHNGHGTHVASTIAESTNNGIGLTGLAYGASIMPVRVLDDHGEGDASDIADGVRFAVKHGAQVINLSLEFSTDVTAHEIPELIDALAYAHHKGVFLVGASGNEAHRSVAYPARANYVVSVGATTEHGCQSDFSNEGTGLDISAPGGGSDALIEGDPDCHPADPPGHDIFQVTLEGTTNRRFGIPSGYEGTSMAAPHVAATAALVIASGVIGPQPTPKQIELRLKATARDLGAPGYDTRYGAGLLDAAAATAPPPPAPPPAPPPGP